MRAIRLWIPAALVAWVGVSLSAAQPGTAVPTFGAAEWTAGQPYAVHRAAGPITIDQAPHPEQWKNTMAVRGFNRAVAQSGSGFQVPGRIAQSHLLGPPEPGTRNQEPCFRPSTSALRPIGTVMALKIDDRKDKKSLKERSAWETGIVSAVQAVGTVNDSSDTDQFYRVILAVPWKNLSHIGGKAPKAGDTWKFTFCRCDHGKQYKKAEESNSAPMTTDDWHRFEQYSTLRFGD